MRRDIFEDWGEDLPGLSLNLFADELPAAYRRDQTGRRLEDFDVLRRCERLAKVRRGCFAGALAMTRDSLAWEIWEFDDAVREGRRDPHERLSLALGFPAAFRPAYDRSFHCHVLAVTVSLWDRMTAGTFRGPRCTVEEMLLGATFPDYWARLGGCELKPGYVDLDDQWLEDDDYLLLYNIEIGTSPEVLAELANSMFTVNLDFASWFKPFYDSYEISGPISEAGLRNVQAGEVSPVTCSSPRNGRARSPA